MYSGEFAYYAPTSLNEALTLLQQGSEGDVKVLAGGQSLIPLIKLRLAEPATLIDMRQVPELRGIHDTGQGVLIGAMTTYFQAIDSPIVQQRCPLIVQTLKQVGDPQVRARGTIGGSIAHADPAGDLPATALALDAQMYVMGPNGQRTVPVADFFVDMLTTSLEPTEVLTGILFAATDQPGVGTAYAKHRHPASGYAVVGVAAVVRMSADGTCSDARIGVTGAGSHAIRAHSAEQALVGRILDDAALSNAASHAADDLDLMDDSYASADFRAHLTHVIAKRALKEAAARARGQA